MAPATRKTKKHTMARVIHMALAKDWLLLLATARETAPVEDLCN